MDSGSKHNVMSDLDTVADSLVYEWSGLDEGDFPLMEDEFWEDAEAFLTKWFERIMNRTV